MEKAPDAFRTISEVSEWLDTPTHVLRFWESRFPQVAPVKRAGGRRYYRVEDVRLLGGIKKLLHEDGVSIKALQDRIKSEGVEPVAALSPALDGFANPAGESADTAPPGQSEADRTPPATAEPPAASPMGRPADTAAQPRQRSLSLGDAPEATTTGGSFASAHTSFQRHPTRSSRTAQPNAAAKPARGAHPTRPGLFVYDDSELPGRNPAPLQDHERTARPKPSLKPIDHVPADVGDNCPPPQPLPATAELRAMAALVSRPLPMAAVNTLSRLRALHTRWR